MNNMSPVMIGYRIIAYTSLALAIAGIVLPLLPTTPFVLLAAWAGGRSSPAFRHWLVNHRTFGPIIDNWQERQVVPRKAKGLACVMLLFSWSILLIAGASHWVLMALGLFFCALIAFLLSRPSE
jgi:hypothetical protein